MEEARSEQEFHIVPEYARTNGQWAPKESIYLRTHVSNLIGRPSEVCTGEGSTGRQRLAGIFEQASADLESVFGCRKSAHACFEKFKSMLFSEWLARQTEVVPA